MFRRCACYVVVKQSTLQEVGFLVRGTGNYTRRIVRRSFFAKLRLSDNKKPGASKKGGAINVCQRSCYHELYFGSNFCR